MNLRRRDYLLGALAFGGTAAGVAGVGVGVDVDGRPDEEAPATATPTPTATEEIPATVQDVKPLARAFTKHIRQYFDARVWITRRGELLMDYSTSSRTAEELKAELYRIAHEYAMVVREGDYEPVTLSITTGRVQAIAPEVTVETYVTGDLTKEAYLETIEVTDVKRTD